MKSNTIDLVVLILVVVGGINWGLVGLLNLNLVEAILGSQTLLTRLVYILVGLAAVYMAVMASKMQRKV